MILIIQRKMVFFLLMLVLTFTTFAENLRFKVTKSTPYMQVGTVKSIQFLDEECIINCENDISLSQWIMPDYSLNIRFEQEGIVYITPVDYLLPLDTREMLSTDITINHDHSNVELWVPSYYADVINSKNRNTLVNYESSWLPYEIELQGGIYYWYEDYNILTGGEVLIFNSAIRFGGPNSFLIKEIDKTVYGYRITCIESKRYNTKHTGANFNWFKGNEVYFDLLMYIDGDYIDLYINSTSQKFGTIMKVGKEFATQFESLIKTNTCDLTNVMWPRRADGSMDYPPPQSTQTAVTEQPEIVDIADYEEATEPDPVEETVGRQTVTGFPWVIIVIIAGIVVIGGATAFVVLRKKR
jgi:hypothetical protein